MLSLRTSARTPERAQERLKRRRALSKDSLSLILISDIYLFPPTPSGLTLSILPLWLDNSFYYTMTRYPCQALVPMFYCGF